MGHATLGALIETEEEKKWRLDVSEFMECLIDDVIWNSDYKNPNYYGWLEERSYEYPERWWKKMQEEQQLEEGRQQPTLDEVMDSWEIDDVGEGWDGDWVDFDTDWGLWDGILIY